MPIKKINIVKSKSMDIMALKITPDASAPVSPVNQRLLLSEQKRINLFECHRRHDTSLPASEMQGYLMSNFVLVILGGSGFECTPPSLDDKRSKKIYR